VSGYGYWLAPIAACMFIDYYVIKKGNLRLPDLFQGNTASRYWYTNGVNYRAVVTVVVALIPCIPSFAAQIDSNHLGMSSTAVNFFFISFLFTYAFASMLYYVSYIVFPEQGDGIVEKSLRREQWADENDIEERAAAILGLAEEGTDRSNEHVTDEKKVARADGTDASIRSD
jgi:nucleobase:cation symporter-1, NCS1 family